MPRRRRPRAHAPPAADPTRAGPGLVAPVAPGPTRTRSSCSRLAIAAHAAPFTQPLRLTAVLRTAVVLLLAAAPRSAAAAPPAETADDARKQAARKAVDAAAAAFTAGDFAGALARFEEAMALRPNPKLHYNLGVCHQRLLRQATTRGDLDAEARHAGAAIDAFNAYLRENPDAPDRSAVETLVRDLGGTPATQPQLRDPLAPLPTAPSEPADRDPPITPRPADPPIVATPPPPPTTPPPPTAPPAIPLPRGYLGAAGGLMSQPQLIGATLLDGAYQALVLFRGGARLGKRRGLELGAQVWIAAPGQTSTMHLALYTQTILADVGHAFSLGHARRFELPIGAEFGVAREGLRVRPGQTLPACAARTSGTLVSARAGGVVGGRVGFAVLVGPRRNHEIGMHIHLAYFGFGRGSAAASCDERPFATAAVPQSRLVLTTSVGYAFRF